MASNKKLSKPEEYILDIANKWSIKAPFITPTRIIDIDEFDPKNLYIDDKTGTPDYSFNNNNVFLYPIKYNMESKIADIEERNKGNPNIPLCLSFGDHYIFNEEGKIIQNPKTIIGPNNSASETIKYYPPTIHTFLYNKTNFKIIETLQKIESFIYDRFNINTNKRTEDSKNFQSIIHKRHEDDKGYFIFPIVNTRYYKDKETGEVVYQEVTTKTTIFHEDGTEQEVNIFSLIGKDMSGSMSLGIICKITEEFKKNKTNIISVKFELHLRHMKIYNKLNNENL